MSQPRQPTRTASAWPIIRDVAAFILGAVILLHQELAREQSDATLVVVGFACLGITGTGVVQRRIMAKLLEPEEPTQREDR